MLRAVAVRCFEILNHTNTEGKSMMINEEVVLTGEIEAIDIQETEDDDDEMLLFKGQGMIMHLVKRCILLTYFVYRSRLVHRYAYIFINTYI
jgi:hypothetical protein